MMKLLRRLFGPPDIAVLKAKKDVGGLFLAINHRSTAIRRDAIIALGELGEKKATDRLKELLADPNDSVGTAAEEALKHILPAKEARKLTRSTALLETRLRPLLAKFYDRDTPRSERLRFAEQIISLGGEQNMISLFDKSESVGDVILASLIDFGSSNALNNLIRKEGNRLIELIVDGNTRRGNHPLRPLLEEVESCKRMGPAADAIAELLRSTFESHRFREGQLEVLCQIADVERKVTHSPEHVIGGDPDIFRSKPFTVTKKIDYSQIRELATEALKRRRP